jgi:Zn-dependent peptidase ImmA (M78 family)/DNA-binding XRE family transcriptional regulator
MRSSSLEIPVTPAVLTWARETIGKTLDDTAKRLDVTRDTAEAWEKGIKHPTLKHLRTLTIFYKRPLAAFFLPSPPQEPLPPADFRSLHSKAKKSFSEKTLLALRRSRRLQNLSRELVLGSGKAAGFKTAKVSLSDNPKILAENTRQVLGISLEMQIKWANEALALNEWRKAIEKRGVLVFELPFPVEEGRAFSFADEDFPTVTLNSNDAITARIFSLIHEYGHLLLGESGICDLSEEEKTIERFCNRFAGEVLVPSTALLAHPIVNSHSGSVWEDEDLQAVAQSFKVSRETVLLRLLILGRTTPEFYEKKRKEWEAKREATSKKQIRRRVPARQCLRQNGIPFTVQVLDSARQEKITYRDVSDYLSIGLKHLPSVESLVREETARYG